MLEWSIIVKIKEGIKKMGPKEEEREMKLKDFHVKCSYSCCAALGSHVLVLLCGQNTLPDYISHHTSQSRADLIPSVWQHRLLFPTGKKVLKWKECHGVFIFIRHFRTHLWTYIFCNYLLVTWAMKWKCTKSSWYWILLAQVIPKKRGGDRIHSVGHLWIPQD